MVDKAYPNLSIIIPTYNDASTIRQVLESILELDYPSRFEIIVVDDCSTDETFEILKEFLSMNKITVVRHERNMGLASAYNSGISSSSGDFLLLLQSDCVPKSKSWLRELVDVMLSDEKIAIVSSKNQLSEEVWNTYGFLDKLYSAKELLPRTLYFGRGVLIRKSVFEKVGLFDDKSHKLAGEDFDFFIRVKKFGYKIICTNSILLHLHSIRQRSLWKKLQKEFLYGMAEAKVVRKHWKFIYGGLNWRNKSHTGKNDALRDYAAPYILLMFSLNIISRVLGNMIFSLLFSIMMLSPIILFSAFLTKQSLCFLKDIKGNYILKIFILFSLNTMRQILFIIGFFIGLFKKRV